MTYISLQTCDVWGIFQSVSSFMNLDGLFSLSLLWRTSPKTIFYLLKTSFISEKLFLSPWAENSLLFLSPPWWCPRAPTPSWPVSLASGWSGPSSSCCAASAAFYSAGWSGTERTDSENNVCGPWRWSRFLLILPDTHRRRHRRSLPRCRGSRHRRSALPRCWRRPSLCRFLIRCHKPTGSACQVMSQGVAWVRT